MSSKQDNCSKRSRDRSVSSSSDTTASEGDYSTPSSGPDLKDSSKRRHKLHKRRRRKRTSSSGSSGSDQDRKGTSSGSLPASLHPDASAGPTKGAPTNVPIKLPSGQLPPGPPPMMQPLGLPSRQQPPIPPPGGPPSLPPPTFSSGVLPTVSSSIQSPSVAKPQPKPFSGFKPKGDQKSIAIKLGGVPIKSSQQSAVPKKVASVFNQDDDSSEEEMPQEAKMRMRNVGRETITSSGPNSFGKTKQGFCDSNKLFEKNLQKAMDQAEEF